MSFRSNYGLVELLQAEFNPTIKMLVFLQRVFDLVDLLFYQYSNMRSTENKVQLNQYDARKDQIQKIVDGRLINSLQQGEWVYENQVREVSSKNKYKYQDVVMSHKVDFLDDMRQIIYDAKRFPEDLNLFSPNTNWKLIGFEDQKYDVPMIVPSKACMRIKGMQGRQINQIWGDFLIQGRLNVKVNDTLSSPYHFNLRKKAILFYPIVAPQLQEKQDLIIPFTETCFNYQSENQQFFTLKFGEKVLKIKKQNDSREAIKAIERYLFLCSFRGAYCLRNEVPSYSVQEYVIKEVDTIKGVDFVHQNKIKEIVGARYYRQAIGGFIYLLNKQAFKRKTLSMQITYPKWLKPHFKTLPNCDLNAITNVVPNKIPLMNLKIKLHQSQIQGLNQNLKYIFPFRKEFMKRTLVVYESNLQDEQVSYMMRQISFPMHTIGLPKNHLSLLGLEHVINAAGTLYHQIVDFSYNAKLISISGSKIFALANANPSIKKLTIKGCYILLGQQDEFFQGLSNNMCLQQFQIDYMDSYNEFMIRHLTNYDAEVY